MNGRRGYHGDGRIVWGGILILLGLIYALDAFGVLSAGDILRYWPLILIGIGATKISARRQAPAGGDSEKSPGERALEGAREGLAASRDGKTELGSVLNEFAFMGGGDRVVRAQDFRGGEVTAIMGGFGIDLRGAAIAGDSATINIFTLWGGVDLKVPEDWNVAVAGTPLLGVFTNSARAFRQGDVAAKTLVVKGVAIMGGVEVKN